MYFLKYLFYFNFEINLLYRRRIFLEILFLSFYNNSIIPYCAKFEKGHFRGVYDLKMDFENCTQYGIILLFPFLSHAPVSLPPASLSLSLICILPLTYPCLSPILVSLCLSLCPTPDQLTN